MWREGDFSFRPSRCSSQLPPRHPTCILGQAYEARLRKTWHDSVPSPKTCSFQLCPADKKDIEKTHVYFHCFTLLPFKSGLNWMDDFFLTKRCGISRNNSDKISQVFHLGSSTYRGPHLALKLQQLEDMLPVMSQPRMEPATCRWERTHIFTPKWLWLD